MFFVLFVALAAGSQTIKKSNIETLFLSDMILKFIIFILKATPPMPPTTTTTTATPQTHKIVPKVVTKG